jgi:iron complex outermembrane recepter protein
MNYLVRTTGRLRSVALLGLISSALTPLHGQTLPPPAADQTPAEVQAQVEDEAETGTDSGERIQEILVTGSSIRGAPPVGSNLITVGREAIEDNAVQSVQQILQTIPQIWGGNAANQGAFASFDASGLAVPQIHGLGGANSSSTLVVIDGHRFPLGGVRRNLPDPNFIPPNSIERVEVLAEGASSIYGSDAVAGVLNFITRRRFEGAEASLQYGFAEGGYRTWSSTVSLGHRWDSGGAAVFYSYSDRGDLLGRDRPLTLPDQRARGGRNFQNFNCGPASIQPNNQNGQQPFQNEDPAITNPSAAQRTGLIFLWPYNGAGIINSTVNSPCEQASEGVLIPQEKRHSVMVKVDQQVGDRLTLSGDLVYSDRRNISRGGVGNNIQATVFGPGSGRGGQINPFYTNPVNAPNATQQTIRFSGDDLFPDGSKSVQGMEIFYGFANAEYELSDKWNVTAFAMAGVATSSERNSGQLCSSCLLLALNGTTNSNGTLNQPAIPGTSLIIQNIPLTTANAVDVWNPRGTNRTSPEVLRRLQDSRNSQVARQVMQQYNLKLDGSLFPLPGGDVRIAVGADYVKQSVASEVVESNNTGPSSQGSSFNAYLYKRTVKALYGEALIPIVSEEMDIPGVRSFVINVSGRYDHYSDFGNITNPKISANWEVFRGFKLRANYSESFVAPQFSTYGPDEYTGLLGQSVDSFFGPRSGNVEVPLDRYPEARLIPACANVTGNICILGGANAPGMQIDGANPNVGPSTGKAWAVGGDFTPTFLPGFSASLTYWHNTLAGAAGSPPLAIVINSTLFHDLLRIYPNGATPAEIEAFRGGRRQRAPLASGPIYFGVDFLNYNVYTVFVEGIDFDVHYRHRAPWGTIRGGIAGTYKTRFDQTVGPGEPVFSILNKNRFLGTFPSIRTELRGDIGIQAGRLKASAFVNYTGGYTFWGSGALNPVTLQNGIPTGGGDKVDDYATVSINISYDLKPDQITAYVDVDNLFDTYPPFVNGAQGFDNFLAFPMGRLINVGLRAKF